MTIYGIPNCETVRKARSWLAARGEAATFYDFRKDGITRDRLERWADAVGWDTLLNRKGTTFRTLSAEERAGADQRDGAIALMLAHPSLIKRPVVERGDAVHVGFSEERWATIFAD
nr:arsenate reductase [Sphingomonas guangdongensis]